MGSREREGLGLASAVKAEMSRSAKSRQERASAEEKSEGILWGWLYKYQERKDRLGSLATAC